MKYIKLFESFIAEVKGYKLVPSSSKVKGWVDQGQGTWMVNCTLGKIYIATVDTQNNGNVSVFLQPNDPAIIKELLKVPELRETQPAGTKTLQINGTAWNYEKMFTLTLTDVTTGDPKLVSIANVLNKIQTVDPAQQAAVEPEVTNYTGLKTSTTVDPKVDPKVKELQTAIINSGNAAAAAALTTPPAKGATGIYGFETISAISILLGIKPGPTEITAEINKKLADKLSAGKKYANAFFGTVVDADGKKIVVADVIRQQKAEDDAKAAVTTTTTTIRV